MLHTLAKNNTRVTRFASVGVINTALDFGILFSLVHLGVDRTVANVISTTLAFLFSFVANKKYAFRSTGGNLKREMLLFTIVTLFGLWVLQTLVIRAGAQLLGESTLMLFVAKVVATLVSTVWNYVLYSRMVFSAGGSDGSHRS